MKEALISDKKCVSVLSEMLAGRKELAYTGIKPPAIHQTTLGNVQVNCDGYKHKV